MKKIIIALLSAVAILLLPACDADSTQDTVTDFDFYYLSTDEIADSVIDSEHRELGFTDSERVWREYLNGPESDSLDSPFPVGAGLDSVEVSDEGTTLYMTEEYSQLAGIDRTLAESCLTKTAYAMNPNGALTIIETDNTTSIRNDEQFLYNIDQENLAEDEITLYFVDESGSYLVAETRSIVSGTGEPEEKYVLDQLLRGPTQEGLTSAIPEGTELNSVEVESGVCLVDFSSEFMENRPKTERQELLTVYAIVNTLSELENVNSVLISVDGSSVEFYRYMSLSQPIEAYDGIIGPVRGSMNEIGIQLYVESWSPDYLAGLPAIVRRKVNITTEEQLLRMLLSFAPPSGYVNPIPEGTTLNSVSVSDGVCTVDLGGKFISGCSNTASGQRLSALAIAATLEQMEYIDSVIILMDGETVSLPEFDLTEAITITEDMFFP